MRFLGLIEKAVRKVNVYLYIGGGLFVLFVMFITTFDVIGRTFGKPLIGAIELSSLALGAMVFLTWAHTQAQKGHISIDLLLRFLPDKARAAFGIFTGLLQLILMALMAWGGFFFAVRSMSRKEYSDILHYPVYPLKFLIVIGAFCISLQFIFDIAECYRTLRGHKKNGDRA